MKTTLFRTLLAIGILSTSGSWSNGEDAVSFRRQVAPILINNCLACHGSKKSEGGYRVDSYERAASEGDSGIRGFRAGDLDGSEALRRIMTDDKAERMPLEGNPLPAAQVELIRRWVEQGARYDARDPQAPLASIVPPPTYPDAPSTYPQTLPVTALEFRPDGRQLIVGGYHELTIWDPVDGKLWQRIGNVGERTYAIQFRPDGELLAVGGGQPGRLGEVRLFDAAPGTLSNVLGSTTDVVLDVAFNPAGDRLAVASADAVLRVFGLTNNDVPLIISSHSDWVTAVAWNEDGSRLASASRDKTTKVFNASTGDLMVTYTGHGQPVKGIAFHPNGKEAYSCAADNKVHQWNIEDGKKTADIGSFRGEVYKLIVNHPFLFAASADRSAQQFELSTRKQVRAYSGHNDWILAIAYHEGTRRLATGSFDGEVRVWDTENGKVLVSFLAAPGFQHSNSK